MAAVMVPVAEIFGSSESAIAKRLWSNRMFQKRGASAIRTSRDLVGQGAFISFVTREGDVDVREVPSNAGLQHGLNTDIGTQLSNDAKARSDGHNAEKWSFSCGAEG